MPKPSCAILPSGYGADIYLEASGHPSAVLQGLNLLRKLGSYVEYGVFAAPVSVDWSIISDDKELDVLGAIWARTAGPPPSDDRIQRLPWTGSAPTNCPSTSSATGSTWSATAPTRSR